MRALRFFYFLFGNFRVSFSKKKHCVFYDNIRGINALSAYFVKERERYWQFFCQFGSIFFLA
jgi:hypothetical protein